MGEQKKLLIDLDASTKRADWRVPCSYYHHPRNDGAARLREMAAFGVFCRHCKEGTCIRACPKEALSRAEDGIVHRASMLCVKCNSCVIACPFGTILEELIPLATSQCDYCVARLSGDEVPLCVKSAADGSLQYVDVSEDPSKDIFALNDHVLVRTRTWKRDPVKGQ